MASLRKQVSAEDEEILISIKLIKLEAVHSKSQRLQESSKK